MVVWSLCDWTPHIYPASTPITNLMWPGPSSPPVVLYCTAFWSWGALSHTAPIPPSFNSSPGPRTLPLRGHCASCLSLWGGPLPPVGDLFAPPLSLLPPSPSLLVLPLSPQRLLTAHCMPDAGLSESYTTHLIQSPSDMLKVTGIQ